MAQKEETEITQACLRWIKVKPRVGDAYHVHGSTMQRKGEPDIDGSLYSDRLGRWVHLKVEVKTQSKDSEPSLLQIVRLRGYYQRGYIAGVVRSVEELAELVRQFENQWLGLEFSIKDEYDLYGIS